MAVMYFPTFHKDELIYSTIARFGAIMEYSNDLVLQRELLGSTGLVARIGLPGRLDDLIRGMPRGHPYTPEQLIFEYTTFPFYSLFLPPDRYQQALTEMRGEEGAKLHLRLGLWNNAVSLPDWLRYCPDCVADERQLYQDGCYWHRLHQLPGILLCPEHNTALVNSSVPLRGRRVIHRFVAAEKVIPLNELNLTTEFELPYTDHLRRIALDVTWLLHQQGPGPGLEWLHTRYKQLLIQRGLAIYKGQVHTRELFTAFQAHYPLELLSMLHCEVDETLSSNWLLRLARTPMNSQHPLHHLLLIHFLGHTAESFFQSQNSPGHFGVGPWPCLNRVCPHYRQSVIHHCEIHYSRNSRRPVGRFACECGFVYQRIGPDKQPDDMFRWRQVEEFGPIWEAALRQMWPDPAVSLMSLTSKLGLDHRGIKRQAVRLGLSFPRPGNLGGQKPVINEQLAQEKTERRAAHRATWLALRDQYPEAGIKELGQRAPGTYVWLIHNDQAWFELLRPELKYPTTRSGKQVDWPERDLVLAVGCLKAALGLLQVEGRPRRLTPWAITREIKQPVVQRHPTNLPLKTALLTRLKEERLPFAIRRIEVTTVYFSQAGIVPTLAKLAKQSSTDRMTDIPEIEQTLATALISLQTPLPQKTCHQETASSLLYELAQQIQNLSGSY